MSIRFVITFTCVFVVGIAAKAQASISSEILAVIRQLENPRNLTRPGPRGELGAYQFREATWRMHTTIPFEQALDASVSDVIAVKHYEWLARGFQRARMPVSPYNIALAWNGGLSAAIRSKSSHAARNYAERAENLFNAARR
jgi:hypothetical protein